MTDDEMPNRFLKMTQIKNSTAKDYITLAFKHINQKSRNSAAEEKMVTQDISNLFLVDDIKKDSRSDKHK